MAGGKKSMEDTQSDCESQGSSGVKEEIADSQGMKNFSGTLVDEKLLITAFDLDVGMGSLNASPASSRVGHSDMNSATRMGSPVIKKRLVARQSQMLEDCESRIEKHKRSDRESARRWRLGKQGMKDLSTLGNVTSIDSNVGMRPLNASYASSGVGHNDMNSVTPMGPSAIEGLVPRQSQTLDDCESRIEKRKRSNKESTRR